MEFAGSSHSPVGGGVSVTQLHSGLVGYLQQVPSFPPPQKANLKNIYLKEENYAEVLKINLRATHP